MSSFRFLGEPFVSRWMGRPLGSLPAAGGSYADRVLAAETWIAYWPFWEAPAIPLPSANDISGNGRDGAYTGVTLGYAGIGDGRTSMYLDGVNDLCNVHSAGLSGAFDFDEGTILIWSDPNAGAWTDGTVRYYYFFYRDASNFFRLTKAAANNTVTFERRDSVGAKAITVAAQSDTVYNTYLLTWSINGGGVLAAGEMAAYKGGAEIGVRATGLNAATGSGLDINNTKVGGVPGNGFLGGLAHCAVSATPASADLIATVSTL